MARKQRAPRSPKTGDRISPRKQFGQHFLTDTNILQRIVNAAEIQSGDVVIEIGPGLGHLTRALLVAGARVVAIEIDPELAARVSDELRDYTALTVLGGDFMKASPADWLAQAGLDGASYKVVANLPYYITSAILRHLLETEQRPLLIVVMVQREVARQLTARPDEMSMLAVSVQFYGDPELVSIIPAGAFYPRPKVDSAIVRIRIRPTARWPNVNARRFFGLARAGFGERRKQLRNALARGLGLDPTEIDLRLARAGLDPRRRAETLSMEEWRQMYDQFA